jgi:GMP synthase (glutamine-hydrolysing)
MGSKQNMDETRRAMLVLVTGDPVPAVRAERGSFYELIRTSVGDAWAGPWVVHDARCDAPDLLSHEWAGVIITGSASSLTERSPWMTSALIYVRRLVEARTPTFGICFGHQLLGEALGGKVERNPAGREIGTVELEVTEVHPFVSHPSGDVTSVPMLVNMTHLDSVVRLPAGARVLAKTQRERHAFVQFAPETWGVQFHPEMDAGVIRHYIRDRDVELVEEGFDLERLLGGARETPQSNQLLKRFARHAATKTSLHDS